MKTKSKTILIISFMVLLHSGLNHLIYASIGGYTGRTLKTSTLGCGSCHGQNPVPEVMVSIAGPDTVNVGQTAMFFLTITKLSKTGAGLDVAVRSGTLSPVSNNIHLANGELTHSTNIPMTNGTVTVQFNYTAPNSVTLDTIWATGLATNSDSTATGDNWNWGLSKRVIVRTPLGIKKIYSQVSDRFSLAQNYPNPFNPSTKIKFELPANDLVSLAIYDITGKTVATLLNSKMKAGVYEIQFDASNYPSGIYFYRLKTSGFTETRKMILEK